jgi:molecular chaperone GrpE
VKPSKYTGRKTTTGEWTIRLSDNILEEKKDNSRNGTHNVPPADPVIEDVAAADNPDTITGELEQGAMSNNNDVGNMLRLEREKSEDYLRRLQYLQADFENYRKRMEREIGDVRRYGNERLLNDLLIVKDELELALAKARETKQNPVLLEGVGMVLKRLQGLLTKEGVEKIPGKGNMFNPEIHEAALRVMSDDEEEGSIVEEIRPGYMLKGRVLRPSIVKVAEKPSSLNDNKSESLKETRGNQ